MPQADIARAKAYVEHRLRSELPSYLYYHGPHHTLDDVVPAADRLAEGEGVSAEDRLILLTGALYHDMGYIEQYEVNEPIAVGYARQTLPEFGYSPDQVEGVCAIIMATQMPQQPHGLLQEIMCDADLDSLGREDFYVTSHNFRMEMARRGQPSTLREWYIQQLAFLTSHQYFTRTAHALRDAHKQEIIAEISDLVNGQ